MTFVIAMLAYVPSVHAAADIQTGKEVIQSYFDNVNTKDVENILEKLDGEYGKNAQHIYTNKENIDNYVGVFNIKKSEVLSIVEASSSERLALDVTDYKGEKITVYKVSVDITKYLDEGEYIEGNNKLYFVLNTNNKIIGCQTLDDMLDMNNVSAIDNGISLLSYDTPVKKPSSNPSTIKVYRTATGKIQRYMFGKTTARKMSYKFTVKSGKISKNKTYYVKVRLKVGNKWTKWSDVKNAKTEKK